MTDTGHRQIDHTGDIALEIWAPTEEALLVEAARAVVSILTEGEDAGRGASRTVAVESIDAEDRLVQLMNEVLVLALTEGFLTSSAAITLFEGGLSATLTGEVAHDKVRTELKSVTYHDLSIVRTEDGLRTRVVIDV